VSEPLRLGFAGTPEFAAIQLAALLEAGYEVDPVYTQPDRPRGRGRKTTPSPVKALALAQSLPVLEPASLKKEVLRDDLDLLIVAAYGLILPRHILEAPRLGCLNVHASLLPRWRGAAPVERAIMAGDGETGVCLMKMDEGLDTGPVYACERTPIEPGESGGDLERRLAHLGADLLIRTLPDIATITPRPQPEEGVTYAHKLTAADSIVDWGASAIAIADQIRALADRRPATVLIGDVRMRLLAAEALDQAPGQPPGTLESANREGLLVACGSGTLKINRLQLNRGKGKPMGASAAINGYPDVLAPGARLLSPDG
jgi:methionyl-tRNA formyltransferase